MKSLLGILLILTGSAISAQADVIGIDLLSETHHLYGYAVSAEQPHINYGTYDVVRSESFSEEISGQFIEPGYYPETVYSQASAGDFSLQTSASRWESKAVAESTYIFKPESYYLDFDISGSVEYYERFESILMFSLTDITTNQIIFDEKYGLPYTVPNWPPDYWDNVSWSEIGKVDKSYNLFLDIAHAYKLDLYALAWGGDDSRFTSLNVDINPTAVPVPEPTTTLLLGTGIVGLIGLRIRRKK